jgi:hypothetical protein
LVIKEYHLSEIIVKANGSEIEAMTWREQELGQRLDE